MVDWARSATALPDAVILSWGIKRALLALGAGALSALAMPPFGLFFVLFLTFPVLIWLLDGAGAAGGRLLAARAAAITGFLFGFGYFLAGLWWIGAAFLVDADSYAWAMPFAVVALPAGLALFPALGLAVARLLWAGGPSRLFALAIGLGGSEWLRGHVLTGFPWNSLGYALADNPLLGQSAALIGMEGLTPVAVFVFAAPALVADEGGWARRFGSLAGALLLLLGAAGYGSVRLARATTDMIPDFSVRIVQPNIAQNDKFRAERKDEIVGRYIALSNSATGPQNRGVADASLLIWPESAFPFLLERAPDTIAAIADLVPAGTILLTGAARAEIPPDGSRPKIYNSIRMLAGDGAFVGTYDKVRLVPFGEVLPFQSWFDRLGIKALTRLPGGFSAGDGPHNLMLPSGLKLAPLICYEAIFPRDTIDRDARPDMLVNVTNDGWFGDTPGPRQHLAQARVRAIETGVPLVRAANTGISAVIDPYGRFVARLDLGIASALDSRVPRALPPTVYVQYGNIALFSIYGLAFLGWIATRARQN